MKSALFVFMTSALAAALPSCSDDQAGSISSRPTNQSTTWIPTEAWKFITQY